MVVLSRHTWPIGGRGEGSPNVERTKPWVLIKLVSVQTCYSKLLDFDPPVASLLWPFIIAHSHCILKVHVGRIGIAFPNELRYKSPL